MCLIRESFKIRNHRLPVMECDGRYTAIRMAIAERPKMVKCPAFKKDMPIKACKERFKVSRLVPAIKAQCSGCKHFHD